MEIDIKIAKKEHLSQIAEIEAATLPEAWSESALELFVREGAFAVVALCEGRVASYCTVIDAPFETQIINVATHKDFRRLGYACLVVERVIEESRAQGAENISLEVRESNDSAISLYRKLGFEVCGTRRGFYKNPTEDALVMVKKL